MRIVYVCAESLDNNCRYVWRCETPIRALNRTGRHAGRLLGVSDFAHTTPKAREVCSWADVIVIERDLFGPVLSAIQHWKARDKALVADFDDAYDLLLPDHPGYPFWIEGVIQHPDLSTERIDPLPLMQFKWGLRMTHGVTVPSRRLADDWRQYNNNVYYLANYIDLEKYQNITLQPHEGIIIGWVGDCQPHLQDFMNSGALAALENVCRARPQVRVMVCGNYENILDHLSIPDEQKIYQPQVPVNQWPRVLSQFDIGLAPQFGPYGERQSWIKVLEYAVMRIPWVASEGPAYADFRRYGWLVRNDASAWERVIFDMVDHLEEYKAEASQEPYLFALSQGIDENIDRIVETYSNIIHAAFGGTATRVNRYEGDTWLLK